MTGLLCKFIERRSVRIVSVLPVCCIKYVCNINISIMKPTLSLPVIMRRLIMVLPALFSCLFCYGQAELRPDFEKAVKLLREENFREAEGAFSDVLGKATADKLKKHCFIYRAFCYNGLGEYKKVVSDLDRAIALDASDLASYIDRGKSKAYADDLEGAQKDFQYVLTKDSTEKQGQAALFYLARIAGQQQQFAQAVRYYDRCLSLDANDAEPYFNRGASKNMLMDLAGAIKDYDAAIRLNPDYKDAYANRGVAKINLLTGKGNLKPTKKQTKEACEDLRKAKQLGDNAVDAMLFLYCDKE